MVDAMGASEANGIIRRFDHAVESLFNVFDFLDIEWAEGPAARRAANTVARREHLNPTLRDLGEELGGIDHYNTLTARGSMARLASERLMSIMYRCEGMGDAVVLPVSGHGEGAVQHLIDHVIAQLIDDGDESWVAALHRESALAALVRDATLTTMDGEPNVLYGGSKTLARNPNAWIGEFAKDTADLLDYYVDHYRRNDDNDDDQYNVTIVKGVDRHVFTPESLHNAVACLVSGEASGLINNSWGALEDAYHEWSNVRDDLSGPATDRDMPTAIRKPAAKLLETARELAAVCTAHAALHESLSPYECM